jgi:hypothetical protein
MGLYKTVGGGMSPSPGRLQNGDWQYTTVTKTKDPDPFNFSVRKADTIGDLTVLMVNYPDATTYEGNKIIVLRKLTMLEAMNLKSLDPHFYEDGKVVARFEPTADGWSDAVAFARGKDHRQHEDAVTSPIDVS